MSYGIIIRNENSETQVTGDSYIWLADPELGSVSVTMKSPLYNDYYADVFYGIQRVSSPSTPYQWGADYSTVAIKLNSSYYYNIAVQDRESPSAHYFGVTGTAGSSFSIPYAVLYYSVAFPETGELQLYWSTGSPGVPGETGCSFSSDMRFPQLAGFYTIASPISGNPPFSDVDVTVSDAVNNFFVLRSEAFAEHQSGDPDWIRWYNIQMTYTSSTNVRVRAANYYSQWNDSGGAGTHNNYTPPYLQLLEFKIPGLI